MAKPKAKARPAPKARTKKAKAKPAKAKARPKAKPAEAGPLLRSIRSVIYQVHDLAVARKFYAGALGKEPYFEQPYYVGFDIDGQELGLNPDVSKLAPGPGGAIAYWRVDDLEGTVMHVQALGGDEIEEPHDVGGGIRTAIVSDPSRNLVGLISGA